jgi:cytochrome c551
MKRLWTVIALLLLILAGCSSNTSEGPMDGDALYEKSCLACHGSDLKGASGPAVVNMKSKYTEEELIDLINNGKGMMPGNLLSEEEAKLVAEWLMEK